MRTSPPTSTRTRSRSLTLTPTATPTPPGDVIRRVSKDSLRPFLNGLFEGLFGVLDRSEGQENEYVMKATMRLLTVVQEDILPVTGEGRGSERKPYLP